MTVCAAIATDRRTLGAWHPGCCPLHMLAYCTWQPCSHKQITIHRLPLAGPVFALGAAVVEMGL